jgi:hypothetical protein
VLTIDDVVNPTPERMELAAKLLGNFREVSTGCVVWTGAHDGNGYGNLYYRPAKRDYRYIRAHRLAYELFVGPVPEGLNLDHLCRNPPCFNPAHLEPVTPAENVLRGISPNAINARKTHCKRGHEFNQENTRINCDGYRQCRECNRAYDKARSHRKRIKRTS